MVFEMPAPDADDALIGVPELAVWVRENIAADDPFALQVIWAATVKLRATCANTTWTPSTVPAPVKLILLQLAKRSYINDRGIVAEGSLGPIGGDRYLDDYARTLQFLPEELNELAGYGAAVVSVDGGALFTLSTAQPDTTDGETYLFAQDGGVSDWAIPYLGEDDAWLGRP